jgi:hypothetical protein
MVSPCDYEEVCFVDKRAIDLVSDSDKITVCAMSSGNNNQIIMDSVNSKIPVTVFAVSNKKTVPLVKSEYVWIGETYNVITTDPCVCIPTQNNNFYITFKGMGSGTIVEAMT